MSVEHLKTDLITTAGEFRREPSKTIRISKQEKKPVAILNHSKLSGYFVPAECLEEDSEMPQKVTKSDIELAKDLMAKYSKQIESLGDR